MELKSIIVIVVFFTSLSLGKSQVGLDFIANQNTYNSWNDLLYDVYSDRHELLDYSYGGGLNYWFCLNYYRLEFTPGLYYLYSDTDISYNEKDINFRANNIGLEVDMNAYIFDFIRKNYKRDCPSFSADNGWLKRSFFVQVSPALYLSYKQIKDSDTDLKVNNIAGKIDFGIGVDMEMFRHLAIAPVIKYGFYIGEKWEGISEYHFRDNYYDATAGSYVSLVLNFYLK